MLTRSAAPGQFRRNDAALRLEDVRQVRVVIERDAIGRKLNHLLDRAGKRFARLTRQTVDKVHVNRAEPFGSSAFEHFLGHLERLNAVDGFLHVRIEVLHAQAHAVEARLAKRLDLGRRAASRIDLDRKFAAFLKRKACIETGHQFENFVIVQKGRRAAAPVQLLERFNSREMFLGKIGFLQKRLDVGGRARMIARDDLVAAAVKANVVAKRNVAVKRKLGGLGCLFAAGKRRLVILRRDAAMESVGRRIGRVARCGNIEFLQKSFIGSSTPARVGSKSILRNLGNFYDKTQTYLL